MAASSPRGQIISCSSRCLAFIGTFLDHKIRRLLRKQTHRVTIWAAIRVPLRSPGRTQDLRWPKETLNEVVSPFGCQASASSPGHGVSTQVVRALLERYDRTFAEDLHNRCGIEYTIGAVAWLIAALLSRVRSVPAPRLDPPLFCSIGDERSPKNWRPLLGSKGVKARDESGYQVTTSEPRRCWGRQRPWWEILI